MSLLAGSAVAWIHFNKGTFDKRLGIVERLKNAEGSGGLAGFVLSWNAECGCRVVDNVRARFFVSSMLVARLVP